jgi:glycosyltransferase involved in cell wall biosynthesis
LRRRAKEFDIVLAHGSTTLPVCAIALVGSGRPFVYRQISDSMFWAGTRRRRVRVKAALSRAAHVVALWDGAAATLARDLGVDPTKITVVPNGVSAAQFPLPSAADRMAARSRIGLAAGGFVVCYVGALVGEKGVDAGLAAVAGVSEAAAFVVVGDGPERAALEQEAARVLGTRARFLGSVESPRDVLWAADVMLFPSRGGDSMPAVVIEAGLSGLPVVATPIAAIPQMIVDGRTGYIVAVDAVVAMTERLEEVMSNGRLRADLGLAAREWCLDRYTMDPVADGWISVIERVLRDL